MADLPREPVDVWPLVEELRIFQSELQADTLQPDAQLIGRAIDALTRLAPDPPPSKE
jgi:hypothetical protein